MGMTDEELMADSTAEITALTESGAGVRLEINVVEAYQLTAVLQLALRHPRFAEHDQVYETTVKIAKFLEGKFAPYPATAEVIRRGWHREYDEPIGPGHPIQ